MAHTPGPWKAEIENHQGTGSWYAAAIGVGSPFDGTYRTLARVCDAEHAYGEEETARVEADAKLIAAAPDLLAALVAIVERGHEGECEVFAGGALGEHCSCGIADGEAAIAKARG